MVATLTLYRYFSNFSSKTTMKTFGLVLTLFIIQRSCGAPIIVYYTVDVFQDAHSSISATAATVYSGIAQFICSAMGVTLVDYVGRRVLLLFSFGIMVTSLFIFLMYLYIVSMGKFPCWLISSLNMTVPLYRVLFKYDCCIIPSTIY